MIVHFCVTFVKITNVSLEVLEFGFQDTVAALLGIQTKGIRNLGYC